MNTVLLLGLNQYTYQNLSLSSRGGEEEMTNKSKKKQEQHKQQELGTSRYKALRQRIKEKNKK
jgi:hypothetical protein